MISEEALEQLIAQGPEAQAPVMKEPTKETFSAPATEKQKAVPENQKKSTTKHPPTSAPSDGTFRRFGYADEKSSKFWSIRVSGTEVGVKYGHIGTEGQSQTKSFDTLEAAQKHAEKLIAEKVGKGYVEVS